MSVIREAWKQLPEPVKEVLRPLLRVRQTGAPPRPDALARIRAMRAEFEKRAPVSPTDRPMRFLFNSQFAWDFGWVEYGLATALKLRGHDVRMVACGGVPSYCELETQLQERPPCDTCTSDLLRHFEAFGLPYCTTNDFVTDADVSEAQDLVDTLDTDALLGLERRGIAVGDLARRNLVQYYKGYHPELDAQAADLFRRCLHSTLLRVEATYRMFETHRPDMAITTNGKFLQWAPFVLIAQRMDITYATWEDFNPVPSGTIYGINEIAQEQRVDAVWDDVKNQPLAQEQRQELHEHFRLWANGTIMPYELNAPSPLDETEDIRTELNLRKDTPLVSCFPNVFWDSSSVAFEGAFEGILDWLMKVTEYARRRPDLDFAIRAHPAERKLPAVFRTTTPIRDELARRCAPLPSNIRVIDPVSPVSSYGLGMMSDVVMTYSSTLGVEFAVRGIRQWATARSYYSGKGFTVDLESPEQMYDLLDRNQFDNRLTPHERELAERFAYVVRLRRVIPFPYLKGGRFNLPSFEALLPGGHPVIDDLCAYLLGRRSYLDVGSRSQVAPCA